MTGRELREVLHLLAASITPAPGGLERIRARTARPRLRRHVRKALAATTARALNSIEKGIDS